MSRTHRILLPALLVFLLGTATWARAEIGLLDAARASIGEPELLGHVQFLASDELEGRGFGTAGGRITHRYLASYYARLGLVPAGEDGTYLQPFEARGKTGRNVAALIRGTDPALRDEIVVVGGHLDHLGRGWNDEGPIFNGADDNASGTAGVLEIAEAFTIARPRRSVLFLHFDGEERGLLGSRHFVENPTVPLDRIVAMLNADMIGRSSDGYLFIGGVGTSPGFRELVTEANRDSSLDLELGEGGRAPSDSSAFYGKKIPVLFFFTNLHEDYHRPGDDWDKIRYGDMARITRFLFTVAHGIADGDERPSFQQADRMALPANFGQRLQARAPGERREGRGRPRLGIRLETSAGAPGAQIASVGEGTPAAVAGMLAGDRVVAFDGSEITKPGDLFEALRGVKPGQVIILKIFREGESREIAIALPGDDSDGG